MASAEHWRTTKNLSDKHHHTLLAFESTAQVESYHRLSNKYISKASKAGCINYAMRKGMSVLDFNENAGKNKKRLQREQTWREEVARRDDMRCKKLRIK